jgi:hypothetical protein
MKELKDLPIYHRPSLPNRPEETSYGSCYPSNIGQYDHIIRIRRCSAMLRTSGD